jgi:hypothetical protein
MELPMRFAIVRSAFLAAAIALGTAPVVSLAHHSFASEFDRDQPFEIEGVVSSVDWTNPHGWLHVDVVEDGESITYDLELPSPSTLMRQGWRRNDVKAGDKVMVTGFRARTRFNVGRASEINREDGEALFRGTREDD